MARASRPRASQRPRRSRTPRRARRQRALTEAAARRMARASRRFAPRCSPTRMASSGAAPHLLAGRASRGRSVCTIHRRACALLSRGEGAVAHGVEGCARAEVQVALCVTSSTDRWQPHGGSVQHSWAPP
eukprot:6171565-Prymnesium_polylepis.2